MQIHDPDPKAESEDDPWAAVSSEFSSIGEKLKEAYRRVADERGPSEADIKAAFTTLIGAWDQVAESVTTVLKDPAVREQLKDAAGAFASALGESMTDLGAELRQEEE